MIARRMMVTLDWRERFRSRTFPQLIRILCDDSGFAVCPKPINVDAQPDPKMPPDAGTKDHAVTVPPERSPELVGAGVEE